jgi:hypothetical protein
MRCGTWLNAYNLLIPNTSLDCTLLVPQTTCSLLNILNSVFLSLSHTHNLLPPPLKPSRVGKQYRFRSITRWCSVPISETLPILTAVFRGFLGPTRQIPGRQVNLAGFESHSGHGCLICVCVFLCLGRGLATGWSPVQTDQETEKSALCSKMGASPQVGARGSKKKCQLCHDTSFKIFSNSSIILSFDPL